MDEGTRGGNERREREEGTRVGTGLFFDHEDPSGAGDVDGLDVVRIVDEVWLDSSVDAVAI